VSTAAGGGGGGGCHGQGFGAPPPPPPPRPPPPPPPPPPAATGRDSSSALARVHATLTHATGGHPGDSHARRLQHYHPSRVGAARASLRCARRALVRGLRRPCRALCPGRRKNGAVSARCVGCRGRIARTRTRIVGQGITSTTIQVGTWAGAMQQRMCHTALPCPPLLLRLSPPLCINSRRATQPPRYHTVAAAAAYPQPSAPHLNLTPILT
jgi:hypothetical protein